jgi:hypothetical protein
MITVVVLLTGLAEIHLAAKGLGSALFDVLHGLEMTWKHALAELVSIFLSMDAEDIR